MVNSHAFNALLEYYDPPIISVIRFIWIVVRMSSLSGKAVDVIFCG